LVLLISQVDRGRVLEIKCGPDTAGMISDHSHHEGIHEQCS